MGICMDCNTDATGRNHDLYDCERISRLSGELGKLEEKLRQAEALIAEYRGDGYLGQEDAHPHPSPPPEEN